MIKREYIKFYSQFLQRDMELLIFGDRGLPVIFFPTRTARFYDYEDWKVIEAIQLPINAGERQIVCVDSADQLSFYNQQLHPADRIHQHTLYEKYILFEVIPFIKQKNSHRQLMVAGCSLGAFHALNIAFRFPQYFCKVLAMSGRYDLTLQLAYFDDLFDGFINHDIYCNMPSRYIHDIESDYAIELLNHLSITIVIGKEDAFLPNNRDLHHALEQKNISHTFYEWDGEAHKAYYWREMLQWYL